LFASFFFAAFFFAMLLFSFGALLEAPRSARRLSDKRRDARKSKQPDLGLSAGQPVYQTPLLRRFCTFGIFVLLASFFFAAFFFAMLLSLLRRVA
jgi:hypothetical protein